MLQSLDVRQRLGRLQPKDVRNYRVRSDIKEDFVACQYTDPSAVQDDFSFEAEGLSYSTLRVAH
jgi:hypothetical protein